MGDDDTPIPSLVKTKKGIQGSAAVENYHGIYIVRVLRREIILVNLVGEHDDFDTVILTTCMIYELLM
jgi:hypothetical protein